MALDQNFKALDIREYLDATHMRGKNITFLDDFSQDEIMSSSALRKCLSRSCARARIF